MATLRIQFPERDEPSVIALRGRRITVGRTPNNTIQILDRTLSGRHAELFEENGHYRVHDAGSSNGVFVNGALISDFHLHEACKLTFGSVECDYDPVGGAEDENAETLPTHAELAALREQNSQLTQKLAILQDELSALHLLQPADGSDTGKVVSQADHEKVAIELATLKEEALKTQQNVAQLHEELAVTLRDNENLQRALDVLKTALDKASPFNASAAAAPVAPSTFAPAPAVTKPAPGVAKPAAALPKPATPVPSVGVQAPPPGVIKPTPVATAPSAPKAGLPARPIPTARPPGAPTLPPGARPAVPAVPSTPKAGPPGMISSSPPKPPGAIPTAAKPILKPAVPKAGPPGMISKTMEDGTKTQRIDA